MLRHVGSRLAVCRFSTTSGLQPSTATSEPDKLFKKIELEVRGHDKAVLQSYMSFLHNACIHLNVECTPTEHLPYVRWVQWLLRSKFVHKKYKLHYETRTHIKRCSVLNVTGSTASTLLEYLQRQVPEGVGMKVTYEELCQLPEPIREDK
uniref:Small ribosomal subunit protein uS10m n=1 Tax=Panagrolaimus sp. JU765 TaxID=591449 RepID=A0AC34RR76_9BILA